MLNLNLNIIGALQPRIFRPNNIFVVRNDEFKDSIVVAMPGTLFEDETTVTPGDYSFGMKNTWDDISAYVRGGTDLPPIGNNLNTVYTGSILSSSIYPTSSTAFPTEGYTGATRMNGANSFIVSESFATGSGTNLSFERNWVMETWIAWENTGSWNTGSAIPQITPNRIFAWKYNIGSFNSSYFWDAINTYTIGPPLVLGVSGSLKFVYDYDNVPGPGSGEIQIIPTIGSAIVPYEWKHIAISYTTGSGPSSGDRYIRQYVNGNLISIDNVYDNAVIRVDVNEPMQIMGSIDEGPNREIPGGYSGSAVSWQDFRVYNGTNKNYTGSIIPIPESMVTTLNTPYV
jgi:hypothetical protein